MSYQALLFCPDEKTARVVSQVLTELDFTVDPCTEPFAAVKKMMAQHFDAVVVDCENEQNATLLFKSARTSGGNQNLLSVALVEGQAGVAKAFRIGANLVLTKPINVEQSKGTLRVARGLLRKAEAGKVAGQAGMPATGESPQPQFSATRQGSAQSPRQDTGIPVTTAGFDLEKEAGPEPDAADAAALESMAEAAIHVSKAPASPAMPSAKPYPWQPISTPSEPMSSALRSAAEATGAATMASTSPAQPTATETTPAPEMRAFSASSQGAAAAPAPIKESPKAKVVPMEPKRPQPAANVMQMPDPFKAGNAGFQTSEDDESIAVATEPAATKQSQGSSKSLVWIAVLVVAAAAGYYGWTRIHVVAPQVASKPAVALQPQAPTPAPMPESATPAAQNGPAASQPALSITDTTALKPQVSSAPKPQAPTPPLAVKPSPEKPAHPETISVTNANSAPVQNEPEPLVVRTESAPVAPAVQQPQPEPQAPPNVMAANTDTKSLAGIIDKPAVTLPKSVPQTLRISQGVSQGLLVKRVQPIYPQQALQMRISGEVQLQAKIAKDGSVRKVQVVKGEPILARAAHDAVQQWKYKPYLLNGVPVEIETEITVDFKLP